MVKYLYLMHHGIKNQRWGVRNGPPYPLNRTTSGLTSPGVLFVSGSSKTQDPESAYYRKRLPAYVRRYLDSSMRNGEKVIVGDAPGIDRQVQDYLRGKQYENVEIYSPGKETRYSADPDWKVHHIDSQYEPGSKQWLEKKDIAMADSSTKALAVILSNGSSATKKNIDRMLSQNKDVRVYQLDEDGGGHLDKDTLKYSTRTANAADILSSMQETVAYRDFNGLKTADQVEKAGGGDCHSQVQYAYKKLNDAGCNPSALFLIEYDKKTGAGGSTHSAVFYQDGGKYIWLENAWEDQSGMHIYPSRAAMVRDIRKKFVASGNKKAYPYVSVAEYDPKGHESGETLQEFIDKIYNE